MASEQAPAQDSPSPSPTTAPKFSFNMHQFKTDFTNNNNKEETMRQYLQNLAKDENSTQFPMTFTIGFYKDFENVPQISFIHRNFVNGQMKHLEEVFKELKASRNAFAIFSSYSDTNSEQKDHKNVTVMVMYSGSELPTNFSESDFYKGYDWEQFGTFSAVRDEYHEAIVSFCSEDSMLTDSCKLNNDRVELK